MNHPVFLSSLNCQLPRLLENLREKIFADVGRARMVYVDEKITLRQVPNPDPLALSDELLRRISECRLFLLVLAGSSHGSRMALPAGPTQVSFLEMEIVAAAFLGKRIRVLRHTSFEPDPQLDLLLDALRFAVPAWSEVQAVETEAELIEQARRIIDRELETAHRHPFFVAPALGRIAQAFYRNRGGKSGYCSFLQDKPLRSYEDLPNLDLAQAILDDVRGAQDQQRILSRLWLVIRELDTPSLDTDRRLERLELLEDALERWSGSSAWYGLNADMALGSLAAINRINALRERRQSMGSLKAGVPLRLWGGMASAKFNVAKNLASLRDRRTVLLDALADIETAIDSEEDDAAGLYAVKGSIHRRLGHVFAGVDALKHSLMLRLARGTPDSELGGTYSELGFARLHALQFRQGLRDCESGVERLRQSGARSTDLARALRKLSVAYAVNGRLTKARAVREESRARAGEANAHDQLR